MSGVIMSPAVGVMVGARGNTEGTILSLRDVISGSDVALDMKELKCD